MKAAATAYCNPQLEHDHTQIDTGKSCAIHQFISVQSNSIRAGGIFLRRIFLGERIRIDFVLRKKKSTNYVHSSTQPHTQTHVIISGSGYGEAAHQRTLFLAQCSQSEWPISLYIYLFFLFVTKQCRTQLTLVEAGLMFGPV